MLVAAGSQSTNIWATFVINPCGAPLVHLLPKWNARYGDSFIFALALDHSR